MKNVKKIFRLIAFSSFALALFSVHDFTLSWFVKNVDVDSGASAQSSGTYFAGGEGTKEKPYLLTDQRHFYNLAWLQYLGYFNQDKDNDGKIDKQYYFKLSNDIDCRNLVIPPIGTTKYPFLGSFDGGNYTISNFKISDTYSELVSHPSAIDEEGNDYHSSGTTINHCSIIGTFGVIGSYNSSPADTFYDTSIPSLSNLYLDDVTISTKTSEVLFGAIAGYVNANIDNCGVHYVTFKIAGKASSLSSFKNVSDFTLIGSYNKEKYKWDGDAESGDTGYGTSTDIKALQESLVANGLSGDDGGKIPKKYALPFRFENTTLTGGGDTSESVATYISTSGTTTIKNLYPASTYKASTKGNNIGYYSGELRTYELDLDYNKDDFGQESGSGANIQNAYLKTPPDDVLNYLKENGTHLIRFTSGQNYDDIKYYSSNFNYIKGAQVGTWTGNLLIPSDGIWVAPKTNGTFRFVFYNADYPTSKVGIAFLVLRRTKSSVYSGDYASPFYCTSSGSGRDYDCKYGYFEYEASTDCEYFISFYNNNSSADAPYIAYMDIGDNGSDSDTKTSIANFDFVTKENNSLTKIKTYDSSTSTYVTNKFYSKSKVTFKIEKTATDTIVAFRRLAESSGGVLYYQSLSILTPSTIGTKTSAEDEKCETVS